MTSTGARSVTLEQGIVDALAAGDDDRAAILLRRAFGREQSADRDDLAELLAELAEYFATVDRPEDALAVAARAALMSSADGEDLEALRWRCRIAEMLLNLGLPDEACAIYAAVAEDAPGQAWVHETAASDYIEVGDFELAFAWSTAGLEQAIAAGDDARCVARLLALRRTTMHQLRLALDDVDEIARGMIEMPHTHSAAADDIALLVELDGDGVAPERALQLLECLRNPGDCDDWPALPPA